MGKFWLLAVLLSVAGAAQAGARAGDILVLSQTAGTGGRGALFSVDPRTGNRSLLSDFGNAAQGPQGVAPASVAISASGRIFVSDLFAGSPEFVGALFEVNRNTGRRTLVSDFGDGGLAVFLYYGLAVASGGDIFAAGNPRTIVRIDPADGTRTLLSDFDDPTQGATAPGRFITDLVLETSGALLVGTASEDLTPASAIYRVDPVTGARNLVSDFQNPLQGADAADLFFSAGMAEQRSGAMAFASGGSIAAPRNLLMRLDPLTGNREVLSDFDDPSQGLTGLSLRGVAVERTGRIVVGVGDASIGSSDASLLFRVQPRTGNRTLLSDPRNPAQGPSFVSITYIAVMPR
jgi:hypothetical protein